MAWCVQSAESWGSARHNPVRLPSLLFLTNVTPGIGYSAFAAAKLGQEESVQYSRW
jgi:hypothetical protein